MTLTDIGDLKAREASARLLFEHNPVPMWLSGEDGAVLAVNDAATGHYGFPREDFLHLSAGDLVAPGAGGRPSATAAGTAASSTSRCFPGRSRSRA